MQAINKKDIPEFLTLKIEKLSNLGYGIAKVDGYVIFTENSCPDDVVKVRIGKKTKNYANAKISEILEPSPHRINPFCPMQKVCGACQLQFIDYNFQLKLKKQITEDTMHSIYGREVEVRETIASPENCGYRHKIQYPVSETKDSKRILAGYYKYGSHDIINIKHCPIQPSYCDEIIEYIRFSAKKYGITGYDEKKHVGDLKHIVIRASRFNNEALVILVMNTSSMSDKFKNFAEDIYEKFENISGIGINFNPNKTNLILGKTTQIVAGESYIQEKLCDKIFKIGARTFFQVNPYCADKIFEYVKEYISNNFKKPVILDAYAGITAFGICLSDIAEKVVSVEEEPASVNLAAEIIKENHIKNVELHNMDAGKFFEEELKEGGRKFDVTILDPPRKGCTETSLDYALRLTKKKIIYVSCNPATLARDLKYLMEHGAKVEYIQPFDMFPHTYHVENVAVITCYE